MKIVIEYDSSWRVSTLDGSNNEPTPKGRKYISSSHGLKTDSNRKYRPITKDTVMGILNRLVGDRRKLYQSRQDDGYIFKELEGALKDEHIIDLGKETQEVLFMRNLSGNTDKDMFSGLISSSHPAFNSEFSQTLWSIPFMPLEDVLTFITKGEFIAPKLDVTLEPVTVADQFVEVVCKLKSAELTPEWEKALNVLKETFKDDDFTLTKSGLFNPLAFYCSAIHLKLKHLEKTHDVSSAISPRGKIPGISRRTFTQADFFRPFTPQKRLVLGNPYLANLKYRNAQDKLVEKTVKMATASGRLLLNLPLDRESGLALKKLIENASVGPFRVGKKGLAHVVEITVD